MAKDDTTNGILSKMVKFVRNPTTNWADLDSKDTDRESSYSKQALKEMIERKRRNDFVRKREFDMLRKIRQRDARSGQDPAARPSFFQSSMPSKPDDRAMTLKKIDEIEAQMSMQWWKTKHGTASSMASSSSFANSDVPSDSTAETQAPAIQPVVPASPAEAAFFKTEPDQLQPSPGPQATTEKPAHATPATSTAHAQAPKPNGPGGLGGLAASYEGGTSGFSASKLFAVDVEEVQHDPELEEAAIRFANGDEAGAEAALRDALSPQGSRANDEDTWLALFDLYRAGGRQDGFESAAIDFASRFDRSAPMWISMPEQVAKLAAPGSGAPAAPAGRAPDWRCPQQLTVQTLAALNAALGKAPMPWHLDWSRLTQIDATAVVALSRLFAAWARQPLQLRFAGGAQLDAVLRKLTPSGQAETAQDCWLLRMEALRIMHRPDEFELAALDFCVTYEVSPPAWESARCEYKSLDDTSTGPGGITIVGEAHLDSISGELDTGMGDTHFNSVQNTQVATVELAGHIQGDATATLQKLESRMQGADLMVISCTHLIRVDFSAAGTLLNWVSARQSEGRVVQFSDVHRLVAAFFHVIGITEHAKVTLRSR